MMRIVFTVIFAFILSFRLFAEEYSVGDIVQENGISYKVLVTYLVIDAKETPDTIKGPDKFYRSGEVMVINVDKDLKDVVIPPVVGRFRVVGLTDSLFYGHGHDRIWLPELQFVGNGCFAKLKMGSGALVVHNVANFGTGVFDELDAELIFDISKKVTWGNAFYRMKEDSSLVPSQPKGLVKINTRMLSHIKYCRVYDDCYSATADNFKRWISKAFNDDERFLKNDLNERKYNLGRRTYPTTSMRGKNGLLITAGARNVKDLGYPWGSLTRDYYRQSKYTVVDKKKRKTSYYQDFIPVADVTQKRGWYVRFVDGEEEVNYTLNGKLIKK